MDQAREGKKGTGEPGCHASVTLEVGASAGTFSNVGHDRTASISDITWQRSNELSSPGVHGLPVLPHEGDDTTGIDLSKVGDRDVSSRLENGTSELSTLHIQSL